jgi:hypothetical protein
MLPEGGAAALERFRPMAAGFQEWYRLSVDGMRRLLQSVKDEAAERLETTVDS